MKSKKCPICSQTKGKRDCLLQNGQLICSLCCAKTRQEDTCADCPHYESAKHHSAIKARNTKEPHFLVELDPDTEEIVNDALELLEKGKASKAREIIEPLLESHPRNHIVHYGMGCIHALAGDTKNAAVHFKLSVDIFPYFVEGWHNLGIASRNQFQITQAVICAQKVVEYGDPSLSEIDDSRLFLRDVKKLAREQNLSLDQFIEAGILFDKASDFMEKRDFELTISQFHKALKVNPSHIQSHGNLGLCYAFTGKKNLALEHIDKALALDPTYEPAANNRVTIEKMEEGKIPTTPILTEHY